MRTVRADVAVVTVSSPVDGRKPRRRTTRRTANRTEAHVIVRPDVMAAARRARRPGERLVIVSAECVMLYPDKRSN